MAPYTLTSLTPLDAPAGAPVLAESAPDGFHVPYPWQAGQGQLGQYGGLGFGRGSSGTITDRKAGRDVPKFWSEIDLRWYRVLARHLCDTNNFAIGFLGHLVGYHVRKGFGWQACLKGSKKTPYASGGKADPLVAKGQSILDAWRDANLWPVRSREAFRRWRRDGEVFGRLFAGGWDRLPAFRFVEPEQVGSPTGDTHTTRSFGIEVSPDDVLERVAYFVRDPEGNGVEGEWIDADKVTHLTANVDCNVKRGVPDFLPMGQELDGLRRALWAMLDTSLEQAKIAWREKFPSAVVDQVRGIIPAYPTNQPQPGQYPTNGFYPPGFAAGNYMPQSKVIRVEGNREFVEGPTAGGVPNYLAVVQAQLRACSTRWGMPENFTGDASNANYASLLAAGSPFVVAVEGAQLEWGSGWERPIALKVLDAAVGAGMLTPDERRRLDVEVTEPAVVTPEPDKDAQVYSTLLDKKVVCLDTVRQKLGYDPQHEAEGVKADAEREAAAQPQQPGPGGDDPQGGGGDDQPDGAMELLGLGEGKKKAGVFAEAAPGPPPRPGLVWNDTTHRWVSQEPPDLAAHAHAGRFVHVARRHTDPAKVKAHAAQTYRKIKAAYAAEWSHIQSAVAAKYGAAVAADPGMAAVKDALTAGLNKAKASVAEIESSLAYAAQHHGGAKPGSSRLESAEAEVAALRDHQKAAVGAAYNALALVIARHKKESTDPAEAARLVREAGYTGQRKDKLGRTTNWQDGKRVAAKKPGPGARAAGKGGAKQAAHAAAKAALADPSKADPKELAAHLANLTAADITAVNKAAGVKGGKLKAEKLDKFLAHVKGLAARPPKAAPTGDPASPHAQLRAALTALGIDHAGHADDALAAKLKAAFGPAAAPAGKPAAAKPTADEGHPAPAVADAPRGGYHTAFAPGHEEAAARKYGRAVAREIHYGAIEGDGVTTLGKVAALVKRAHPEATDGDVMAAASWLADRGVVEANSMTEVQHLKDTNPLGGGKDPKTSTLWRDGRALHYWLPHRAGGTERRAADAIKELG
jgi:hypothetical protein